MACFTFSTHTGEEVYVKTAISGVSTEGALANINELDGLTFESVKSRAEELWEKELGKYHVAGDLKTKRTFIPAPIMPLCIRLYFRMPMVVIES